VRAFTPAADGGQPRNVVLYQWIKLGKVGRGYLSDVYDTPPALRTTDRPPLQDYAHHIHLSWKRPDQVRNSFAPIWRATPEFILTGVDITSMPARRSANRRQMVRRYHLDYLLMGQRSLLTSFQEEGQCPAVVTEGGNGLLPATACPRRPATTMRYSAPESNRIPSQILLTSAIAGMPVPTEDLHLIPIDVNGDSLPDFLESDPGNSTFNSPRKEDRHLYLYNGVWHEEHTLTNAHAAFSLWGYTVTGDFTADSRLGLLYALLTGPGADISMPGGFHSQVRLFKENAPGAWTLENQSRPNWGLPWTYTQPDPFFVRLKLVGDVNGDGLPDLVNFGGQDYPGFGFGTAPHQPNSKRPDWDKNADIAVAFGSRYIFGGPLENPNEAHRSEVGFVTAVTCEGPSWSNMDGDWDDNAHVVQMADMDGDGLSDIVAIGRSQIHYWPSTGRGDFTACTGPSCGCTTPTATAQFNTFLPHDLGPDPAPTRIRLADVNGDGFADLISWDNTGLRVSFNVDGFRFEPPIFIEGTWFSSTWAKDVDDKAVEVSFADMNRNGITDIVVVAHNHISALDLHRIINVARALAPDAWAPRPGLLIKIDNGLGLSHSIAYETTAELASIALDQKQPWAEPMPQTMQVVQRVTSRNGAPNAQPLRTYYDYADPAWDGWERRLRGFRKVTVTRGGDVPINTTDTFYFPPCPERFCGSLDATFTRLDAAGGMPLVTEVSDNQDRYLSTVSRSYTVIDGLPGIDGRVVHSVYLSQLDSRLYDTTDWQPSSATAQQSIVAGQRERNVLWTGAVPIRAKINTLLRSTFVQDPYGNVVQSVAYGHIKDDGGLIDDPVVTAVLQNPPRSDWRFLPARVQTGAASARPGVPPDQARITVFEQDAGGRLTAMQGLLTGTLPLDRHHQDPSAAVAAAPPGASVDGMVLVARYTYDQFDNVVQIETSGDCGAFIYDPTMPNFP